MLAARLPLAGEMSSFRGLAHVVQVCTLPVIRFYQAALRAETRKPALFLFIASRAVCVAL